jgi:predicted DNA-binding transcriptional regulator YafY
MAPNSGRKPKLLYLSEMLLNETDDEHGLTIPQMIRRLDQLGIKAERKAIYTDLETLRDFGYDIIVRRSSRTEYAIGKRHFELAELLLLSDAVQSSRSLTERKSKALLEKLQQLTSVHNKQQLSKRMHVEGRIKMQNESIYYNIDRIQEAIRMKSKIAFTYFEYGIDKQEVLRREGRQYHENPIDLVYKDEYYYLITYNDDHDSFLRYRVDRMRSIVVSNEQVTRSERVRSFDVADFTARAFGMFGGDEITAKLRVDVSLIGSIIDRFGKDVTLVKINDQIVRAEVSILKSAVFFGWLVQFGDKLRIESPKALAREYCDYLAAIVDSYQ